MGSSTGQKVGEVIITALWPLIWVIYVLVSLVIFVEVAAVYLSWGIVSRLDRVFKKARTQPAA
ncbi:MAG: hypothetical protein QUS33_12340 [Dehalococcoidia bacterium]|nr:hypothetical protein [Dehalococcoidia bacterium]